MTDKLIIEIDYELADAIDDAYWYQEIEDRAWEAYENVKQHVNADKRTVGGRAFKAAFSRVQDAETNKNAAYLRLGRMIADRDRDYAPDSETLRKYIQTEFEQTT